MRIASFFLLGNRDRDVASVFDDVAKLLQPHLEAGYAYSGGPHVHTTAGLAEIERHTDDADFAWGDFGG